MLLSIHLLNRLNLWYRLAVHTRVICIFCLVFAIALTPNGKWWAWVIYAIAALIILLLSRVNFKNLSQRMAIEFAFACVMLLGTLFRGGGQVLWQWRWLQISEQGLIVLGSVATKAFLSLLLLNILTLSTSIPLLLQALVILKMPPLLVSILASMYRYIGVLANEFNAMRRAAMARNFAPQNLYKPHRRDHQWQRQVLGNMLGMLFIRTYDRGDRIYHAMLARGYRGVAVLDESPVQISRCDVIAIASTIFVILIGIYISITV